MIIAIDYGNSKCGYAIGSRFISKSGTIKTKEIMKLLSNSIGKVVLGFPLSMSGNYSMQSLKVLEFAKKLSEKRYNVFLIDERLTTKMASSFGIKDDDAFSARQIFMDFIDNPSISQKFELVSYLNENFDYENIFYYEIAPNKKNKGEAYTKNYSIAYLHLKMGNFTYSNKDTIEKKYNVIVTTKDFEEDAKQFLSSNGKIVIV